MKNNICRICLEESELKYLESHTDSGQEYKLYGCSRCGAQFWEPFKNPGAEWYEKDERYLRRSNEPDIGLKQNYKVILDFLKPFSGRVLDVGCGSGVFLYWTKKYGWDVHGFDFGDSAIETGKKVLNLSNIEVNDLNGYYNSHRGAKFDLITFFDVLEHVDNPGEFIEIVKNILKSSGYVSMSMPYRKMARWLNPHDLPPRHLTRWNRKSIRNFLEEHGFKVVQINRRTEGLKHIIMKLRFKFGKHLSFNLVGKMREKKKKEARSGIVGESVGVKHIHLLAKIKDWMIFFVPALIVWLVMLPTSKRYATLYVIAQKND